MMKFIHHVLLLTAFSASANAASFVVSNVTDGLSDTVYTQGGVPMTSGVVAIGYFPVGFPVVPAVSSFDYALLIANFVVVNSAQIGSPSATLGGSFAGYPESGVSVDLGAIGSGNPLWDGISTPLLETVPHLELPLSSAC